MGNKIKVCFKHSARYTGRCQQCADEEAFANLIQRVDKELATPPPRDQLAQFSKEVRDLVSELSIKSCPIHREPYAKARLNGKGILYCESCLKEDVERMKHGQGQR